MAAARVIPSADVLVGRPHLVRVAAASDDRKGTPVALVQGEIGTIGGEHRSGRGQREEILLPKTQRIVVAGAQVGGNALRIQAVQSIEETQVVAIGRANRIEDVAGNDHEIDLARHGRLHYAIPSTGNGIYQTARPFIGQRPQAAKRRTDVQVGAW